MTADTIDLVPAALSLDALIAKYEGRAPRYTSYPTAVQFTPSVDATTYRAWLAELPAEAPVSVYVHVPFCSRLCWYCGCNTRAVNRHDPIAAYLNLLIAELALLEKALPKRMTAQSVHLGGGTPNMLTPDDLDQLFSALRRVFHTSENLEVAAELDPASLTREWVQAAKRHGLTRASLGVQSLDPQVQAAVNRTESFERIAECVGWLREAGIASVNLDLMYGLPHQTEANLLATIEQILRLRPERIALFGYAHVPWMKSHQQLIDANALPGSAERLDQSERAAEYLVAHGYTRIGLDHFALPEDELALAYEQGRMRRNFQGYTADPPVTLLGIGASAIGSLPQGFVQNAAQETTWRAAIADGNFAVSRGVALSAEDRFRGEIIERLMCDLKVDLAEICARHGRSVESLAPELARLADFEADGLVRLAPARIVITELGRLLVRSISAVFDQYFAPEAERHSRAL
ncbi:MAG TPA: oxygen-independent coproporphyrinogen III oxidase [Phenylobacterium sp.]|nr:oxygen-independent coproporphyrinogen III oxidase [Phenylobacterium sp.]